MKWLETNSLSRVLFRITATAILAVTLAAVLVSLTVLYSTFLDENQEDLVASADHVAAGVELGGLEYLNALQPHSDFRITWIGADGIYNFTQGGIQLYQILRHKTVKDLHQQWKVYRTGGYLVIGMHLTMTGMIFQMIHMGRHESASEISIIASAAFTFYKLISGFVSVAKDRKHKNPLDSSVIFLNFAQALYNLFVLQVGLLWVFGGAEYPYQKLMNTLTGIAVCMLVLGMGVYMVRRANRNLSKAKSTA